MKVYFTLTDGIKNDEMNLNMLKLCLKTAKENTSLQLNVLYDGSADDNVYQIFKEYGVNVILCKCSFVNQLENYYKNWQFEGLLNSLKRMLGCFMKFDIALYEKEDEVVLYSDIDTIFAKDTDWSIFDGVKTLAAAPEFNRETFDTIKGYRYFSAGIMVLNVEMLKKRREKLLYMLDNNMQPYQECWDQGFFNELYKDDFETLPFEFNWKPYWGINDKAVIVHVHGWKLGHQLKKEHFDFCCWLLNLTEEAFEGIIYYTVMGYRVLNLNKDRQIAALANYLLKCKMFNEKDRPLSKTFKISSYILYKIYKNTKKYAFLEKIHKYSEKKLQKRNIIADKQKFLTFIKED